MNVGRQFQSLRARVHEPGYAFLHQTDLQGEMTGGWGSYHSDLQVDGLPRGERSRKNSSFALDRQHLLIVKPPVA